MVITHRNFISRLAVCALLPYAVFAFGAQWMHTCLKCNGSDYNARTAIHEYAHLPALCAATEGSKTACAACEWTHSTLSGSQSVYTLALSPTARPFTGLPGVEYHHNSTIYISARAPPGQLISS